MQKYTKMLERKSRITTFYILVSMFISSVTTMLCDSSFFDLAQSSAESATSSFTDAYKAWFWPLFVVTLILFAVVPKDIKKIFGGVLALLFLTRIVIEIGPTIEATASDIAGWFGGNDTGNASNQNTFKNFFGL